MGINQLLDGLEKDFQTRFGMRGMPRASQFQQSLAPILGQEEANQVLAAARDNFLSLQKNLDLPASRALRSHLQRSILPGLALHRALQARYPGENAQQILEGVFKDWGRRQRRALQPLASLPFYFPLLRMLIRSQISFQFPEQGWKIEWVEISRNRIALNMRSCYYLDFLQSQDASEIAHLYCWLDDLIHDQLSPHVSWQRKGTLARGDDLCDFCFIRKSAARESQNSADQGGI